jgi:glycerophosphoryl diester phosphodiesterase
MKIIGHRGALALAEENTLLSFKAALHEKVDAIELDVRSSSDGVLVVHHDPTVHSLVIKKVSYHNLKAAQPNLLTLQEALEYLRTKCPLIIEIKKGTDIKALLKELKKLKLPRKGIIISSFHLPALRALKKEFPDICLAVNEKWSGVRAGRRARLLGTKYITMNQRWLWFGFIKAVSRSGYKLSAYPVNDPIKAYRWEKYGLYGVITDSPDRFH